MLPSLIRNSTVFFVFPGLIGVYSVKSSKHEWKSYYLIVWEAFLPVKSRLSRYLWRETHSWDYKTASWVNLFRSLIFLGSSNFFRPRPEVWLCSVFDILITFGFCFCFFRETFGDAAWTTAYFNTRNAEEQLVSELLTQEQLSCTNSHTNF